MNSLLQEKVHVYRDLTRRISHFEEAVSLMNWDVKTGAPPEGIPQRAEVIATISAEAFKISTSDEMGNILEELKKPENLKELDIINMRSVEEDYKRFLNLSKISQGKYKEYISTITKAQQAWKVAKLNKDFSLFKPYLEKIVQFNKEKAKLLDNSGHPYNALLDEYEAGITVEKLDNIFSQMKEPLKELLKKVKRTRYAPDYSILNRPLDINKQKRLILMLLENMGFKSSKGRLDTTMHPFAVKINGGDIRITINKLHPKTFRSNLYAALHEGGHGLYGQNLGENLIYTSLHNGTSHGIHEAQSRFWENIIGKSLDFWYYFKEELGNEFPHQFNDVSPEDLYHSVNILRETTIRTAADEISYNLHVILRYELEKDLISGDLGVEDLPNKWNEKTFEYFGIYPENDGSGILQDVHWALGYIGYFPTYTLGNIYSVQFMEKLKKDIPNVNKIVRNGEFSEITNWFSSNVYPFGKLLLPEELIEEVTGEGINPQLYINYLENKFSEIYDL